jgi:predicted RNase H-like nuclease
MLFIGVDLAWEEGTELRPANETGLVCLGRTGAVLAAGWVRGLDETLAWIAAVSGDGDCLVAVDAPLVVNNATGQRLCEKQVGQRYGRWQVSANTTNLSSPRHAGVALLSRLASQGWRYTDGLAGPPETGRHVFECYPYTTLVGVEELGYTQERPRYKRKPKTMPTAAWRPLRAAACDELLTRLATLTTADPPLILESHPVTEALLGEPSPLTHAAYKHREDLIDAAVCAWTASLWSRYGFDRCQVLGGDDGVGRQVPTIIAPTRPEQRREAKSGVS